MSIYQASHTHTLVEVNINEEFTCQSCKTPGQGRAIKCTTCNYLTHHFCSTCPPVLIQSHLHQHRLSLGDNSNNPWIIICNMCDDLVTGSCYTSITGRFHLHPLCTKFPHQLEHASHSNHALTLTFADHSSLNSCLVCGKPCYRGRYTCNQCDIHVHVKCLGHWTVDQVRPVSSSRDENRSGYLHPPPVQCGGYYPPNFCYGQTQNYHSHHPPLPYVGYYPHFPAPGQTQNYHPPPPPQLGRTRDKIYSILSAISVNVVASALTTGLAFFNPFGVDGFDV